MNTILNFLINKDVMLFFFALNAVFAERAAEAGNWPLCILNTVGAFMLWDSLRNKIEG